MNHPLICDPETGVCILPAQEATARKATTAHQSEKPLRVVYYTDPICSSCWGIEPQLRRLKLEYGHALEFDYRMGGLLPDWGYNSGGINKPADVAQHWDEVSETYQMPIDGDVWLEDPLSSSFPPSVAFKAAQMQSSEKAIDFLRAMRELLFLQKKNITKWEHLEAAAKRAGLDSGQLQQDMENGKAQALFEEDLAYAKQIGVRGFPSIFFVNQQGEEAFVYGVRPYSHFEDAVQKLFPEVEKQSFDPSLESLFQQYPGLTAKEYSVLTDSTLAVAFSQLEKSVAEGAINSWKTRNGNLYLSAGQ